MHNRYAHYITMMTLDDILTNHQINADKINAVAVNTSLFFNTKSS